MKLSKVITSALLGTLLITAIPAQAKDPCKTVLCMWGKLKSANPGECNDAVQDYFDIVKKKKGKIKWSQTADARQDFLDSCPSADSGATKKINGKFGKVRG